MADEVFVEDQGDAGREDPSLVLIYFATIFSTRPPEMSAT